MARQSLNNINNNHLLFQNLNNDDFESSNNTNMSDSFPIDMDRLSQLTFILLKQIRILRFPTKILNLIYRSIQTNYSVIITYQRISKK